MAEYNPGSMKPRPESDRAQRIRSACTKMCFNCGAEVELGMTHICPTNQWEPYPQPQDDLPLQEKMEEEQK